MLEQTANPLARQLENAGSAGNHSKSWNAFARILVVRDNQSALGGFFRLRQPRGLMSVRFMKGKSDLEIAREARLKPITEIGAALGLSGEELDCYERHKAKTRRATNHDDDLVCEDLWVHGRNLFGGSEGAEDTATLPVGGRFGPFPGEGIGNLDFNRIGNPFFSTRTRGGCGTGSNLYDRASSPACASQADRPVGRRAATSSGDMRDACRTVVRPKLVRSVGAVDDDAAIGTFGGFEFEVEQVFLVFAGQPQHMVGVGGQFAILDFPDAWLARDGVSG